MGPANGTPRGLNEQDPYRSLAAVSVALVLCGGVLPAQRLSPFGVAVHAPGPRRKHRAGVRRDSESNPWVGTVIASFLTGQPSRAMLLHRILRRGGHPHFRAGDRHDSPPFSQSSGNDHSSGTSPASSPRPSASPRPTPSGTLHRPARRLTRQAARQRITTGDIQVLLLLPAAVVTQHNGN